MALLLSFIGNLDKNLTKLPLQDRTWQTQAKVVLDTIPTAIKVFRPKTRSIAGSETWVLTVAETLGSLITFSAILVLLWAVLKEQIEKRRISLLRRHTILLGFDTKARLFLKSQQRPRDRSLVVVDPAASEVTRDLAHEDGCLHYASGSKEDFCARLAACRMRHAERVIISSGEDAGNLELLKQLADCTLASPAEVILNIEDTALYQKIEQNDALMQSLGPATNLRLFNGAKAAAHDLVSRTNFTQLAEQMQQNRVSLVLFGATCGATEVLTHFLRLSPSHLGAKPMVTWVVESRAELLKLLSLNYPPLFALVSDPSQTSPLAWAVDLEIIETGEDRAPYDPSILTTVAQKSATPTALIMVEDTDKLGKTNVQLGTALRSAAVRFDALSAPIFVSSETASAEDKFLICRNHTDVTLSQTTLAKTDDLAQVIEPFGRSDEICAWGTKDTEREALAQSLHEEYLRDRGIEGDTETQRAASLQPWATLAETYKNSNRRAADKRQALDYVRSRICAGSADISPKDLEALAALEHDAWWIDRELDDWSHAPARDNRKKLHPDLIPYQDLPDAIKDYDRAKVRSLIGQNQVN